MRRRQATDRATRDTMGGMGNGRRTLVGACLLAACLAASGCATSALWDDGPDESVYDRVDFDEGAVKAKRPLWIKLALTPVTLAMDVVSLPLIAFLEDPFEWLIPDGDDDDDDDLRRSPKIPRAPPPSTPSQPKPTGATATQPREP